MSHIVNKHIICPCSLWQRSGGGRPRVHNRRRLRKQPDPDLQPRRKLPQGVRQLGLRRQRVQGTGGGGCHEQRQHPGVRPREPPSPSLLRWLKVYTIVRNVLELWTTNYVLYLETV